MDHDPNCGADIVHDLDVMPWPVESDVFDEVHAYEVLEHLGSQGDFRSFFAHFGEIYRALKDGGILFATVPAWDSVWAWADPSHRRVIARSEEHTSELQSLMRSSYAVFCLKKINITLQLIKHPSSRDKEPRPHN